jgi:ABC-2 type transport system ATP-binding protein
MAQVELLCDRVGILHEGELVAVDTVDALREQVDTDRCVLLTVANVPADLDVAAIDGVVDVDTVAGGTRITCRDAAAMGPVVSRLDAAGVTIRGLDTAGGTLEQVFLAATDTAPTGENPTAEVLAEP